MNVSKIVGVYVKWLRVEPAILLSFQYKLSFEHKISFGIKCAVHTHTHTHIYIYIYYSFYCSCT